MHHHLSYIHPNAKLGKNVVVEPFVNIQGDVEIGDNTWIGSNVSIMNGTRVGSDCKIFPGAILGGLPQDLKFNGEYTQLIVGNNVTIREYCTLNRGTSANMKTIIKDNAFLMAYVHVAHDCIIGKNCILANNVNLAGHIELGDYAILGGLTAVHQFVKIGEHVIVGGGSLVGKDVPPYVKAARYPLSYIGLNSIGLRRRGFKSEDIHFIQNVYRLLFVRGMNTTQAIQHIKETIEDNYYKTKIIEFVESSERGIMRGFKSIHANKTR
jgi:UDP-N-acetylglucosamine acyltransferase